MNTYKNSHSWEFLCILEFITVKKADNRYKNKRWDRKRAAILKRDGYRCQECKRYGRSATATTVHHINPLEDYPQLMYADDNLLSLCGSCHDQMHDRVNNILTSLGLQWVLRTEEVLKNKKDQSPPSFPNTCN
ncbi:MAG: HNH endonuclease [Anaerofustis sp.]